MIHRFRELIRTNKSLSLISSGTAAIIGLVTYGLLARSFSMEELGYWTIFMTVFTLFDMLRTGLVSNAMIKKINESDDEDEVAVIIGSSWRLNIYITLIGSAILALVFFSIFLFTDNDNYRIISIWFIPISFLSLPHSIAVWTLNAYVKFGKILWIRMILQLVFLIGVVYQYNFQPGLQFVLLAYFIANLIPAVLSTITGWNKIKFFNSGNRSMNLSLFNFGKYSMGALIGSNFLRSSDTFIIAIFLGPGAVAMYNVPERLLGLFDIPLRSFVVIAFPQMVKKFSLGLKKEFRDEFETSAGFSTLLLLPVSVIAFIFAEPMVVALGGEEYRESANILRVFAVYTALTPLDRFSGIALDVINRPDLNFIKVIIMLLANIVGDLIVLQFTNNLVWIAMISIITFGVGILIGFILLKEHVPFRLGTILQKGYSEVLRLVSKYVGKSA